MYSSIQILEAGIYFIKEFLSMNHWSHSLEPKIKGIYEI